MFPWIALGLLVFIILLLYILKWRRGRNLAHLPTYTYVPFFGTTYKLIGGSKALHNQILEVSEIMNETNLPFVYWAGIKPIIILQDPHDLKLLTNEFVEKPYFYNFSKIWLGESLATTSGHIWKHNVKSYIKALKPKSVNTYRDVFNTQAKKLVNSLKIVESCNVFPELAYITFETICNICTGDLEVPNLISVNEFYEATSGVTEKIISRMINVLYHPDFIFKRTQTYRDLIKHLMVLHNLSENIMKRYKQNQLSQKLANQISNKGAHKSKFKPFLSYFVEIGLTEEEIKSEIDLLIFAQDPPATALLMIFIIIGTKQDIQDKMYNEIKEILGDDKRDVVEADLERMVYCEGVIRETLRLYPPGPIVLRKIDEDFEIKSCTIPKDSMCLINMWGSGRSKSLWGADVLEFRPERWIEPSLLPPVLAFSYGKRGCVGVKYAYMLMKTIMAHSIREFKFESDMTKLKIKVDIVLKIYEGLDTLKITKREAI